MKEKKDYKFIKDFSKIKVSTVCNDLRINRQNILNGTASNDNIKKVKDEIKSRIQKIWD